LKPSNSSSRAAVDVVGCKVCFFIYSFRLKGLARLEASDRPTSMMNWAISTKHRRHVIMAARNFLHRKSRRNDDNCVSEKRQQAAICMRNARLCSLITIISGEFLRAEFMSVHHLRSKMLSPEAFE
jgi:hypothetical protein